MRRWILTIGALLIAPAAALAGVDGTHHDMTSAGYNQSTEKCAYCHSKVLSSTTLSATFGATGNFCMLVCHDGTTLTDATPASPGYFINDWTTTGAQTDPSVVAFDISHGRSPVNMPSPDQDVDVANTGWPHSSDTTDMECTTCHAVHDGTNPPFLNAAMSATTGNADSFCQRCHTGSLNTADTDFAERYEVITAMGAHPTEFAYSTTAGGLGPTQHTDKLPRALEIKAALLYRAPTVDTKANFNLPGAHWETGGHFYDATNTDMPAAGVTDDAGLNGQTFGCYSCHSAHAGRFASTSSTAAIFQGANELLLSSMRGGATANLRAPGTAGNGWSGVAGDTSLICNGCHGETTAVGGVAGNVNNPGVTQYYHPANAEAALPYQHDHSRHLAADQTTAVVTTSDPNIPSSGVFPIPIRTAGSTTTIGGTLIPATYAGANGEVLCTACHDVHGGVEGTMALRYISATFPAQLPSNGGTSVCVGCHAESTTPQATNAHHPGRGPTSTPAMDYTATAGGAWSDPSWTTGDDLGSLADGLSCPDCHVFNASNGGRTTAHNW